MPKKNMYTTTKEVKLLNQDIIQFIRSGEALHEIRSQLSPNGYTLFLVCLSQLHKEADKYRSILNYSDAFRILSLNSSKFSEEARIEKVYHTVYSFMLLALAGGSEKNFWHMGVVASIDNNGIDHFDLEFDRHIAPYLYDIVDSMHREGIIFF